MKTPLPSFRVITHCHVPAGLRPIGFGILVIIYSSESLFAVKPQRAVMAITVPNGEMLQLDPGPVGVTSTAPPATWSYDLPQGQVRRSGEAAGHSAANVLEWAAVEPRADLLLGAIGVVEAPFAAGISGLEVSRERLAPSKLTEVEAGLATAMSNLAQQHHLRDTIIAAAQANYPRRFVLLDTQANSSALRDQHQPLHTFLETSVSELRLVRLGSSDTSFALQIQARARLLRSADQAVLRDNSFTYQTKPDLFLDWALNRGEPFAKCAQTGYRHIADRILSDLMQRTGEAPLLTGPGRKNISPKLTGLAHATLRQRENLIAPVATIQFAAQPLANSGNLYVMPSPQREWFTVQKPLTRDEALSEAMSDIEWAMDGLDRHPNVFVALSTMTVMAPVGFYHQTIGLAIHGESKKNIQTADQSIASAINHAQPSHALATQIAQHLGERNFDDVVLIKPGPDHPQLARAPTPGARRILTAWPNPTTDTFRTDDKLLKIEVTKAALRGPAGSNPKLAICLEARITLLSAGTADTLHTCTAQYQSDSHKYSRWAADDARLFRAELARGYAQLSATALDEMIARRWITPTQMPATTIAGH